MVESSPLQAERRRPGPLLALLVSLATIAALAVTAGIVMALLRVYYWQGNEYRDSHWVVDGDGLKVLKIAFYTILTLSVPIAAALGVISARVLRVSQVATVTATFFALGLLSYPVLATLSFSNACELGVSFPFSMTC